MTQGRVLGERYEVRSELGRGGMATVYEGHDRVLDRPVAVKVLADRYSGDQRFVERFQREARAAAGLNHRNIVSVYDSGAEDGEHYIVMELVRGETLADLLAREAPLGPERAVRIAAFVAEALDAAHGQGFVHRDVKPGNVMLTEAGEVKVMDFGIARAATDDTLTQTGIVLGTASYLSPEQSRGDQVDHRSDVYSLGCVLYEMLAGQPPFSGGSPVSVAYRHVNENPVQPSRHNPRIPAELEDVTMRALEKDPADRLQSAAAFREALMAASAGAGEPTEPVHEKTAVLPVAPTEPLAEAPRRRPWLVGAAVVAAIVAVALAALAMTGDRDRRLSREERQQRQAERGDRGPTPAPTTTATALDEALFGLEILLDASEGLMPPDAIAGIAVEVEAAKREYLDGKVDKAFDHLARADSVVSASLAEGTTTEETAASLHQGIALVRETMQGELPEETVEPEPSPEETSDEEDEDGEGEDGPGNSENAPGQIKKEGKDEDD